MKKAFLISYLVICFIVVPQSYSAVTSIGEINVVGETKGIVPASSTVPLLVTLSIDRSLAEPGEEIKTIEITMPNGFETKVTDFKSITRDGEKLQATVNISSGNVIRVELAKDIRDFQNSIYNILFDARTPNTIILAEFKVILRNNEDTPVGEFIRAGQADSKLNNDDFTLQVIPNVPPSPVTSFTAASDTTGENDVTLRWLKSDDPDVNGYILYRNIKTEDTETVVINVENRASTTFRDVNVPPGEHSYQIAAYKTILLQSERSDRLTVIVSEDTAAPLPPTAIKIEAKMEGVELNWNASGSRDVIKYRIWFGSSESATLEPLTEGEIAVNNTTNGLSEYKYFDQRQIPKGSFTFTYAVTAIDEAGNESPPTQKRLRVFDKPFPNPFTPLSNDSDFNTVVFPKRTIEDGEGEFNVLLFNLNGVLVKSLTAQLNVDELRWDGRNESGEVVESGIYIYQLQVGESFATGTIIVAK